MFENSKVIWSEGMFLRPQHFQQHDRYLENLINRRCLVLRPYGWGFYSLTIDSDQFRVGKLSIKECKGIFPDGTPFNMPEDDELPLPMDIPQETRDEIIYLCLPLRRAEAVETDSDLSPDGLARLRLNEREASDNTDKNGEKVPLQVGKLKTRIMRQADERSGYTCLGLVRVTEVRADKNIIIGESFIPATLNCFSVSKLRGFMMELNGMLNTRGEAIAPLVNKPDQDGVSGLREYLLLQMVNRYQAVFEHLANVVGLHPEEFYRSGIQLAGELATIFRPDKRPVSLPAYAHDDLQATFSPLMKELRELLGKVDKPPAINLTLKGPKYSIYAAQTPDFSLIKNAVFVLAANAEVPPETLRSELPHQIIISPIEEIHLRVKKMISGIPIHPLSHVPRQIPHHAGFTYFELNKHHEDWEKMLKSSGFAFHISRDFPGLKLEFWAIQDV